MTATTLEPDVQHDESPTTGTMGWTTALRLAASGGRSDRLRVGLTASGAALATVGLLTAASVVFIRADNGPYRLDVLAQPGLRPGVIVAVLLLCVPILSFVGQCSRVGAPARDRRLAMLRMAGATPSDVVRVAAAETGLAAGLGALLGTGLFFAGRSLVGFSAVTNYTTTTTEGQSIVIDDVRGTTLLLPVDVELPILAVVGIVAVIALGATAAAIIALRKVTISPFGVVRSKITRPPAVAPFVLAVGGTIGLMILGGLVETGLTSSFLVVLALALFIATAVGLALGSAAIAAALGRIIVSRTSRPALLIAGRRMISAPFTASRASTAIVLAVLIGSFVQGLRANWLIITDPEDTFYADAFNLVNMVLVIGIALSTASLLVVTAESMIARRRTLAALAAAGTPRSVLARAVLIETLLPVAATVLMASIAGILAVRGLLGTTVQAMVTPDDGDSFTVERAVPIPWAELGLLSVGTILLCAVITGLSLLTLRSSTNVAELRAAA